MDISSERASRPDEGVQVQKVLNKNDKCQNTRGYIINQQQVSELSIMYTNADNLLNKRKDLEFQIASMKLKPHIIAITEIKPKIISTKLLASEFNIEGYDLFHSELDNKSERGVLIYTMNSLICSCLDIPLAFSEGIFLTIKLQGARSLILGNIYRSPSSNLENNIKINEAITYITSKFQDPVLIVGDFNYGDIDWNFLDVPEHVTHSNEYLFVKALRENFLLQHVTEPTRYRGADTPHILDLVISNGNFVSDIINLSPLGHSDHSILSFKCFLGSESNTNPEKFILSKGKYSELRSYMRRDWDQEFVDMDDIEAMWNHFKDIIHSGMDLFIPKSFRRLEGMERKKLYPFNDKIKKLIHQKHRKWNRVIETQDVLTVRQYKQIRNKVRAESRKIQALGQADIAKSCKTNPKKFWKFVKSKTNYKCGIGDLKYINDKNEEVVVKDDGEKADALVNFFSSVFTKEDGDPIDNIKVHPCKKPMSDIVFTEEGILLKLKKLRLDKSPGLDGIHPRVLNEIREEIAYPLSLIYNKSLNSSTLPSDWKSGVVTAIYKKGSKTDMGNYRPISLTSILCKIIESIIRDHIMKHLIENCLISNKQYGFMKGRSTALQLLHMLDKWTEFLEGEGQIDAIYTDFEKAFDKVPHKRLIKKLQAFGINSNLISWTTSFLSNRKHCVRVNGKFSQWKAVLSGIPQGSILGPLLFIIYINDLPDICEGDVGMYLFADDAKLFKFIKSRADCSVLQTNLDKLQEWSNNWLLKLNVKKCKVISFGRGITDKHDYSILVDNTASLLGRETYISDLGIILDEDLKFRQHMHDKINKAFSMLGVIKRNFKNLTMESFILLYKSMVRSHLEYCNSVWAPHKKNDRFIAELERVQRRATKLVHGLSKLKYSERLKRCGLPTLIYRRHRGDMIETCKMLTGVYDSNIMELDPLYMVKWNGYGECLALQRGAPRVWHQ
jgi:hypothetical protein